MKKTLILLPLILAAFISVAQQTPVQKDRAYFLQKSKNQRIGAWILTGAGAALHIIATNSKQKADLVITTLPFQRPGYHAGSEKKMLALLWKIPLSKQASQQSYFAN